VNRTPSACGIDKFRGFWQQPGDVSAFARTATRIAPAGRLRDPPAEPVSGRHLSLVELLRQRKRRTEFSEPGVILPGGTGLRDLRRTSRPSGCRNLSWTAPRLDLSNDADHQPESRDWLRRRSAVVVGPWAGITGSDLGSTCENSFSGAWWLTSWSLPMDSRGCQTCTAASAKSGDLHCCSADKRSRTVWIGVNQVYTSVMAGGPPGLGARMTVLLKNFLLALLIAGALLFLASGVRRAPPPG